MARIDLTPQEIDYIGRVVETELGRTGNVQRVSPDEYERMVGAVVDTVLNRKASGQFPGTIEEVLNEHRAFSKIAGPSKLNPYGTVANAPKASEQTQRVVNEHLAQRAMGKPSLIGGSVNYANRNASDRKNIDGWIDPMIAAGSLRLGNPNTGFVHDHGVAPGFFPAPPITVGTPPGFMPPVEPDQVRYGLPSVPSFAPTDRPQTYGNVGWEQDRRGLAVLAPPTASPYVGLTPEATESLQMLSEMRGPAGVNLTSAARNEDQNSAALGVRDSEHLKGNAYDVSLRGMSDAEKASVVERAMMSGAKSLGTYTVTDPSHVGVLHVDFQDRGSPNVHAMVDGSSRNMAAAPDWFTQGLSQVTVPTPTPRPEFFPAPPSFPAAPVPPVQRAGALPPVSPPPAPTPFNAKDVHIPGSFPVPSFPKDFVPRGPSLPNYPGISPWATSPMTSLGMTIAEYLGFGPEEAKAPNFAGGKSPRSAQEIPVNVPSPPRPDNAAYAGPKGNFNVSPPVAPPAVPAAVMAPPVAQPSPFEVTLPELAPVPTAAPRNAEASLLGGMMGPAMKQIGQNIKSNVRGQPINPFAGIPQAYRDAFRGLGNRFNGMFGGSLPPPTPFTVGRGLSAIEAVRAGGMKPGATAYSNSHPGASWSVNAYGIPELSTQHGFSGPVPDGF